ncbi:MAG: hypothetical protein JSU06_19975 [Actinobacteria bacterium]|nr:hypothetical protein [Actinomycetota bacterium]
MPTVISEVSPLDLLARFRGPVVSSRPGYPEVLLLKVEDAEGEEWWFSTFHAEYSPSDPDLFAGKVVVGANLDVRSGVLTIRFSDASELSVVPIPAEDGEPDDLESWHLISPDGLVLDYGPGERWVLRRGTKF